MENQKDFFIALDAKIKQYSKIRILTWTYYDNGQKMNLCIGPFPGNPEIPFSIYNGTYGQHYEPETIKIDITEDEFVLIAQEFIEKFSITKDKIVDKGGPWCYLVGTVKLNQKEITITFGCPKNNCVKMDLRGCINLQRVKNN